MASQFIPGDSKQRIALSKKGTRTSGQVRSKQHIDQSKRGTRYIDLLKKGTRTSGSLHKTSSADGVVNRTASANNGSLPRFDLPMYPSTADFRGKLLLYSSLERKFPDAFSPTTAEKYSRKVFIGGLPLDLEKEDILFHFRRFGHLKLEYPHQMQRKSNAPPTRYAFLDFEEEVSVHKLIRSCCQVGKQHFLIIKYTPRGSHLVKKERVRINPWRVADSYYSNLFGSCTMRRRKGWRAVDTYYDNWNVSHTMQCRNEGVFVWGVPRYLKASELAEKMARRYGRVVFAAIECDANFKYPTGAALVVFQTFQSFINAVFSRFINIKARRGRLETTLYLEPQILDDQFCDNCDQSRYNDMPTSFFGGDIYCLKYYCEHCRATFYCPLHRQLHLPLPRF